GTPAEWSLRARPAAADGRGQSSRKPDGAQRLPRGRSGSARRRPPWTRRRRPPGSLDDYQETSLTIPAYCAVPCRSVAVKVAVIGGGSTYTPELVEGFLAHADRLEVSELVLHDIDPDRLDVVGGLARRIMERRGWPGRLVMTGDRDRAIEGADFVIVQLRVGGQAARLVDETLPLEFGCIGQETTGPGGFAKALRTVPVVLDIAESTARIGAKGAWVVDFTNPVGIVTQALLDEGHRAIGLCNVAIGFQRRFAKRLGVAPDRVALDHVGLNHLTWERAVRVDGVDRLPDLIESAADEIGADIGSPAPVIRLLAAIPSYYLRYFYFTDLVLA